MRERILQSDTVLIPLHHITYTYSYIYIYIYGKYVYMCIYVCLAELFCTWEVPIVVVSCGRIMHMDPYCFFSIDAKGAKCIGTSSLLSLHLSISVSRSEIHVIAISYLPII